MLKTAHEDNPSVGFAASSPLGKGSLLESGTTAGSCTAQKPPVKPPLCKGRCHGAAVTEGLTKGAHEGRRLWRMQAVVSPVRQGVSQASPASVEGREAAGAPRTRSEAKSAGAEQRAAEGGTVRRCETTMPHCGTVARRSRDGGIDQRGARRPSVAGSFSLAQQHLAIRANRSPLPTGRLPGR